VLEPGYGEAEYNLGGGSCLILILLSVSHYMNYGSLWLPPAHCDRVEKMKHIDIQYYTLFIEAQCSYGGTIKVFPLG